MVQAVARRLGVFLLTALVASVVVFLLLSVLPGDPARVQLGLEASAADVARLRAELGLDRPLPVRYLTWVTGLLQGDLGISLATRTPVAPQVMAALGVSLLLVTTAMVIAVVLALPIGVVTAQRRHRLDGIVLAGVTQLGVAVPNFLLGLLLVALFAVRLGWFPAGGWPAAGSGPGAVVPYLVLPALALGLVRAAILARYTRAAVIDVEREPFLRTARAGGLTATQALWRHGVRHALVPVVTVTGVEFSALIIGAVVIENVFVLPGMGSLLLRSVANRDLIAVQAVVMVIVLLVLVVNLLVDVVHTLIDPRLRGTS